MTLRRHTRFSLLELVVVLVLLTTISALVLPRLTGFSRGRQLDDEARRLWALTRYAQALAINQALPVRVWLAPAAGRYGVEAVPGYGYDCPTLSYELPAALTVSAAAAATPTPTDGNTDADTDMAVLTLTWWPDGTLAADSADAWVLADTARPGDAWRLARQAPLSTFALTREPTP